MNLGTLCDPELDIQCYSSSRTYMIAIRLLNLEAIMEILYLWVTKKRIDWDFGPNLCSSTVSLFNFELMHGHCSSMRPKSSRKGTGPVDIGRRGALHSSRCSLLQQKRHTTQSPIPTSCMRSDSTTVK